MELFPLYSQNAPLRPLQKPHLAVEIFPSTTGTHSLEMPTLIVLLRGYVSSPGLCHIMVQRIALVTLDIDYLDIPKINMLVYSKNDIQSIRRLTRKPQVLCMTSQVKYMRNRG